MPPINPGSLGEANYLNIAAYIFQQNGARPGTVALTAQNTTGIRTFATGQPAQGGRGGQAKQAADAKGKAAPAAPRGLLVAGEVKNYSNVTDAMLRNPDPADWLMIRRDYKANNYSPLNQINKKLVPVWKKEYFADGEVWVEGEWDDSVAKANS